MNSKVNLSFRKKMKKNSQVTVDGIRKELLNSRFVIQSHNKDKLKKSLFLTNDSHLIDKTLLTPSVHKIHSKSLFERYLKHIDTKSKKVYKFLTLLHSVEILNEQRILDSVEEMRYQIHKVVSESKSIWCLGSIEVEVVSLGMMRTIKEEDKFSESEHRKLDVLEQLSKRLRKKKERESESLVLIHFHGIITSSNEYYLERFLSNLKLNSNWKRTKRQIELKNLSTSFYGSYKSLKENIKHISTYITKGGNDWYGNKSYLRYKIGFDNESYDSEDSWIKKNWRRNELLRKEQKEEGIEDVLSMNRFEISLLTNVIYKIMCLNKDKKGYLIYSKSGKHSKDIYQNYIKKQQSKNKISSTLFDISH
jgi:hypothetical protein